MKKNKYLKNIPNIFVLNASQLVLLATLFIFVATVSAESKTAFEATGTTGLVVFDPGLNIDVEPILPIPLKIDLDANKVILGELLFKDKTLSSNGQYACENCHLFDKGATDHTALSPAINGKTRALNTPTLFNIGQMKLLGWHGKRTTLGDTAEAIIKSKKGLAADWPSLLKKLKANPKYLSGFNSAYSDGIQIDNVKDALAEFMKSLYTPNSRFDQYLRGNTSAITNEELAGYRLFKSYGCSSCHQGVNLGGNMITPAGVFGNFVKDRGEETPADLGLYNKTGNLSDKYVFRVPTLRNIAITQPYLHDGSAQSLDQAVDIMGRYMLGRNLSVDEINLMVKFLGTLTGEYKGRAL